MSDERTGILVILDGFGVNPDPSYNAVARANAPTLRRLLEDYPHTTLEASEHYVGLPPGFMGNSEVGHLNIGAGRVVYQDFSLISKAIQDGNFFKNVPLTRLMTQVKENKKALHLMGLLSDGGVHSHISHLFSLIQMAKQQGVEKVWIHAFTDGRDTSPVSGIKFLRDTLEYSHDSGMGKVATVMGRFYAMDRDTRWERTEKAYRAIVLGKEDKELPRFKDPVEYLSREYDSARTDEFILPGVASDYPGVSDGDGIIFYNFRADRARQITRALTQSEFSFFRRVNLPQLSGFVCMTPYDESFRLPTAFEKAKVNGTLGELISRQGQKQLRIAETEKYAHVTYFFNGGSEKVFEGETRVLIPSPRDVKTYDQKPEMSANEVETRLLKELDSQKYRLVVVNFANPDMVGHTGNLPAAIRAVETVDHCLKGIVDWVEKHEAFLLVTADHGNCELMQAPDGTPLTSHTLLPVPFIVVDPKNAKKIHLRTGGKLCDIAPTMLSLMDIAKAPEMTGINLIE